MSKLTAVLDFLRVGSLAGLAAADAFGLREVAQQGNLQAAAALSVGAVGSIAAAALLAIDLRRNSSARSFAFVRAASRKRR